MDMCLGNKFRRLKENPLEGISEAFLSTFVQNTGKISDHTLGTSQGQLVQKAADFVQEGCTVSPQGSITAHQTAPRLLGFSYNHANSIQTFTIPTSWQADKQAYTKQPCEGVNGENPIKYRGDSVCARTTL